MRGDRDMFEEFATRHLSTSDFLGLPQMSLDTANAEAFLGKLARRGYLLVSIATDVAEHGDPMFRQRRETPQPLMPSAPYWQRNVKFHNWLCDANQIHLPIRFGPHPAEPTALAWLIPAPEEGEIIANGFRKPWVLDAGLRGQWLLEWARQIGGQHHPAQRLLLQMPGEMQPARWYYRNYLGDLNIEGPQVERVLTLLAGLPRYPYKQTGPPLPGSPDEAGQYLLLVNEYPRTWGDGEMRSKEHCELSPFWGLTSYV